MSAWSVAFQVVNFLVLAGVLRHFLFRPVASMIHQRQQAIERQKAEAEGIRQEAEGLRREAEHARGNIRAERTSLLEEARRQMTEEREKTLATARAEAEALLEGAHKDIDHERDLAAEKIYSEAVALGISLAQRLVEQAGSTNVAEVFLARLCERLGEFVTRRKDFLEHELEGGEVIVATAPALDAEAQRRWLSSIVSELGDGVRARFIQDDTLIAGAELRLPHTSFSFSFRDGLQLAHDDLVRHVQRP